MHIAYLLLGSNEGDRFSWLGNALQLIGEQCGQVSAISSIYQTAAWGLENQAAFLNQVLKIETSLSPEQLLAATLGIEISLGRHRQIKWGPRIIDIDILFYDNAVINEPGLIIPHPMLHRRRFTLVPLAEIAPSLIHPVLNKTITELLSDCEDKLDVELIN